MNWVEQDYGDDPEQQSPTVQIVDDYEDVRPILRCWLEGLGCHAVVSIVDAHPCRCGGASKLGGFLVNAATIYESNF